VYSSIKKKRANLRRSCLNKPASTQGRVSETYQMDPIQPHCCCISYHPKSSTLQACNKWVCAL